MFIYRPLDLIRSTVDATPCPCGAVACFVIHPPTHELAEMLVIDSTALQDENYSGIYDENGDYIPQYCDNPEDIPQGSMVANPGGTPGTTPGTQEESVENNPANSEASESANESS